MLRTNCNPPQEAPAAPGGHVCDVRPQAKLVKRPTLTLSGQSIDQEEYDHFHYQYKERIGDGGDSPAKLLEFLAPDMSKMLYSSLCTELKNPNEQSIFEHQTDCAGKNL
jgi:hypothetical protein